MKSLFWFIFFFLIVCVPWRLFFFLIFAEFHFVSPLGKKKFQKKTRKLGNRNEIIVLVHFFFPHCLRTVAFIFFFNICRISFCLSIGKKKISKKNPETRK